ncbi:MAG: Tim44-like domain-containing protein [Bacteroidota bacterium]|nr:Tim44-like domain-containing protein [Bacteroidota bacterium]
MKKIILHSLLFIFLAFSSHELYARAGGSGGKKSSSSRSSSSSSYSSGSSSSYRSSGSSGGLSTMAWIGIGGGILAIWLIRYLINKNKSGAGASDSGSSSFIAPQNGNMPVIGNEFLAVNPGFNKDEFKGKVKIAFMAIQEAWMQQNLSKVRKWISDGVYQRFNLQFEMMKKLEQVNNLSNIDIKQIQFIKAYTEGSFSIITVGISFSMDDEFISKKMKGLNEKFKGDSATEVWTFVKKSGKVEKDLYHSNNCPNCGSSLGDDGGEVSKCPSCSTVTYLGDYDWVLSEITQEEDFNADNNTVPLDPSLTDLMSKESICIQNMEDKAANAFVHYLFAKAWNDTKPFNRFATDEALAELKASFQEPFVFNRVYINRVTCKRFDTDEDLNKFHFSIKYSGQKVKLSSDDVKLIDKEIDSFTCSLTLGKKAGAELSKGKLWSHDCPGCGAPYADTSSSNCSYCGEKINSTDKEWVVTAVA